MKYEWTVRVIWDVDPNTVSAEVSGPMLAPTGFSDYGVSTPPTWVIYDAMKRVAEAIKVAHEREEGTLYVPF